MAIFAATVPTDVGPVRSSRYYFIAWASEYKAMYVHAGGSPQALSTLPAQGNGQLVYNADEFRYGGSFRRISTPGRPAQPVHDRARSSASWRRPSTRPPPPKAIWTFNPPAQPEDRPVGGTISFAYPQNAIRYIVRPDDEHLPADGQRRRRPARCGDQGPDRPDQRDHHVDEVRPAQ